MTIKQAKFSVGQIVRHKRFDYRGVIIDVDPDFKGSDEWYQLMAMSNPPKDQPWYQVLVHDATHTTYVAERNLVAEDAAEQINHPLVAHYFADFADGMYRQRHKH